MEKLSTEIREVTEEKIFNPEQHLRETAQKWAAYVLQHNINKALTLGLKISEAIGHYLNEIGYDVDIPEDTTKE